MSSEQKVSQADLIQDIERIALQLNINPWEVTKAKYFGNGGRFTEWNLRCHGGLTGLLKDYYGDVANNTAVAETLAGAADRLKEIFRGDKNEFIEDGNTASAESISPSPKTLDELLAVCKVDLDIWSVDKWVCNKWAQGSKLGTGDDAYIQVTPLYQIKAWLVRKVPEAILYPVVSPIHCSVTPSKASVKDCSYNPMIRRAVIWPDIQMGFKRDMRTGRLIPLHDRSALDIALQLTSYITPDRIVLLGDNLDLAEFSDKFVKSPEHYFTTQPAVAELGWWLAQLRAIDRDTRIEWIEGNHDRRFLLSIINHNASAYDLRPADDMDGHALMSIERLLGLDTLDIQYYGPYPNGEVWLNDNLRIQHGEIARSKSGATVKAVVEDLRHSEVQGHIHRMEMATKTSWTREGAKTYMAFSPGTLCRLDPGVVPGNKYRQNWQQGIAVIDYELGNGFFNINPIQIHNGRAVFDGQVWESRSDSELISLIESDISPFRVS